jgi:hypothetical protein
LKEIKIITPEERLEIIRNRTVEERFDILMNLIKINAMMKTAKITHKEWPKDKK